MADVIEQPGTNARTGAADCSLVVNAGDILDLADKCDQDGKPALAEWLRLEVRHHAEAIAWQECMHEREPLLYSAPITSYRYPKG